MTKTYNPFHAFLSSAGKGKRYLEKGDKELKSGNVGNAIKYYEKARKYSPDDAQERLNNIYPSLSPGSNKISAQLTVVPPYKETAKDSQQLFKFNNPYFPASHSRSDSSLSSTVSSSLLTQELANYTIQDAPSTLILASMFMGAIGEEKKSIHIIIDKIIQQFDENSSSKESIQELTVLASIPDQQIFISIINQLLKVEQSSPTFPELTIHGLAVILTCAPKEIDLKERQGLLANILVRLQFRLENTRSENNSEEILPLIRALTALFDAMLCRKMRHLGRLDVFNPIKDRLTDLSSYENVGPEISFLARYAIQSLAYIGNDESLSMSIFRRGRLAIGIIVDIKSAVLDFDLGVFESVYDKIMSMSDFSIKMEWYQGLLFLDCLLADENFSDFEKFVIESKLNKNEQFIQGVCLRLEQVASLYLNTQVSQGAQRLLQDLESHPETSCQIMARMVINRLRTVTSSEVTQIRSLAPVWDISWYTDTKSRLLKAAQDKQRQEMNMLTMDSALIAIHGDLKMIIPERSNISAINKALMDHYSTQLTIRRISGKPLAVESCYINLAIVEAGDQRAQDAIGVKGEQEKFIRMQSFENVSSTNIEYSIPLADILEKRILLKGNVGVPKRILVVGRAGVGKTTLCKKLIHTFQSGQWNDRFDSVLWIPLRLLKNLKARNLEALLLEKYFTEGTENVRKGLAHEFIKSSEKGRVLYILDGLDEFVTSYDVEEGDPLHYFVTSLLRKPNVIITTRPHGNDKSLLGELDLELETVGFSTDNVEQYVKSAFSDSDHSNEVLDFIRQTPLVQGLVNIPIQLDLLCFSWKDLPTNTNNTSTTIAQLYKIIVRKLWCSDAIRMRKLIGGKTASEKLFKYRSLDLIDTGMRAMTDFLGYLAFQGLKSGHQLVFDADFLMIRHDELCNHKIQKGQPRLPEDLIHEVMESSILNNTNSEATSSIDTDHETWSFIHLTFQEYFAATWLSKYFQIDQQDPLCRETLLDYDETMDFIRQHKYDSRYEIVWWMIAGQLEGEALSAYFRLLQDAPRDLIGAQHVLLISGCYKESYTRLGSDLSTQIKTELVEWLRFDLELLDGTPISIIGQHNVFPPEILIDSLSWSSQQAKILRTLYYHKYLKPSNVERLVQMISSTNRVDLVINVLGHQYFLSESTTMALVNLLQNENMIIREAAIKALRKQSRLSTSTITALISDLKHTNPRVKETAAKILGNQSLLSESITMALVNALQDTDSNVRKAVVEALGNQSTLSISTIDAITDVLHDKESGIRSAAVRAFGNQLVLSDSMITAILEAQQDEDWSVRKASVEASGKHFALSDLTKTAVVNALHDVDSNVRETAAIALGSQSMLLGSTITALTNALQDPESKVRVAAVRAIGNQPTLLDSTTTALVDALQDTDPVVGTVVGYALGNQSTLSDSTASALVRALYNQNTRQSASYSLKKHPLSEPTKMTLIDALQDTDPMVRGMAISVLGPGTTVSDSSITMALIDALHDAEQYVRLSAAYALGYHSSSSDAITALTNTLQDEDRWVKEEAALSLTNQPTLLETQVAHIITSLKKDITSRLCDKIGTWRVYASVRFLTIDEIGSLYCNGLFAHSCDFYGSLFIYKNRLQCFSAQGFYQTDELGPEVLEKIKLAFTAVQKSAGISTISYE